jgi:hypothetical protein
MFKTIPTNILIPSISMEIRTFSYFHPFIYTALISENYNSEQKWGNKNKITHSVRTGDVHEVRH